MASKCLRRPSEKQLPYLRLRREGAGPATGCRIRGTSGHCSGAGPVSLNEGASTRRGGAGKSGAVRHRALLSLQERERIGDLRSHGTSMQAIGRALGPSLGTISREIKRNSHPVLAALRC
jgi:hypothetical protein